MNTCLKIDTYSSAYYCLSEGSRSANWLSYRDMKGLIEPRIESHLKERTPNRENRTTARRIPTKRVAKTIPPAFYPHHGHQPSASDWIRVTRRFILLWNEIACSGGNPSNRVLCKSQGLESCRAREELAVMPMPCLPLILLSPEHGTKWLLSYLNRGCEGQSDWKKRWLEDG